MTIEKNRSLPDVGGGTTPTRLWAGVKAVFVGIGLVFSDRRLLLLSLVPMLVHVGLFALFVWIGFIKIAGPLTRWLGPADGDNSTLAVMLGLLATIVVAVVVVVGSLVATVLAGSVVCDPFYDLLSERTEELLVGRNVAPPFSASLVARGLVRELVATVLRLLVWAAVAVPLWALSLTPATIVATPASFVWTWLFFAYEYLSRSLVRHAVQPKDRFKPISDHKALCVGFGGMAWLASFVPFVAPFLVVSATRLYLALAAFDRVSSKLTEAEKLHLKT